MKHLLILTIFPVLFSQINAMDNSKSACLSANVLLLYAAKCGKSGDDLRKYISAGASLFARDSKENTPLHLAALYGNRDTVLDLLRLGADKTARNGEYQTPFDLAPDFIRPLLIIHQLAPMGRKSKVLPRISRISPED
jgi:ankyrin repeat protein